MKLVFFTGLNFILQVQKNTHISLQNYNKIFCMKIVHNYVFMGNQIVKRGKF